MKNKNMLKPDGILPPKEKPENPVWKHILDDGPGGPGKITKEKQKKERDKWKWRKKPGEPDYLNLDSDPTLVHLPDETLKIPESRSNIIIHDDGPGGPGEITKRKQEEEKAHWEWLKKMQNPDDSDLAKAEAFLQKLSEKEASEADEAPEQEEFQESDGFYPPEEEPEDPIRKHILDDGPDGPGELTKDILRKKWDQEPEPDYFDSLDDDGISKLIDDGE